MTNQQKALIGDAVFSLLSREYACKQYSIINKTGHPYTFLRINSNREMGLLAIKIGIVPKKEPGDYRWKGAGTFFEIYVYDLYKENGFDYMTHWFENIIVPLYLTQFSEIDN